MAGVRWGDDDLIPPDSLRRCKICKQPIEHLAPNRVCCGHPRCARANRARANRGLRPTRADRIAQSISEMPKTPAQIEAEILSRIRFAEARGASRLQAIEWTARKMEISTAQVMSTLNRKR